MSLGKAAILGVLFWWVGAWMDPGQLRAGYPLITDDTGVQGKAGFQIEFNGTLGYDREQDTVERSTEMATVLSYGVSSNADLVLGIPYSICGREMKANPSRGMGYRTYLLRLSGDFMKWMV